MAKKRKLNRRSKKGGNDSIEYQTVEDMQQSAMSDAPVHYGTYDNSPSIISIVLVLLLLVGYITLILWLFGVIGSSKDEDDDKDK